MPRIVAICPKEYVGVKSVLQHGEYLKLWKAVSLGDEIPENDILILGAWHPDYLKLIKEHNCGCYITSTVGQMDLSARQIELYQLAEIASKLHNNELKFVISGSPDTVLLFSNFSENSYHCPYPFAKDFIETFKISVDKIPNSIGIFLPSAIRKNLSNQINAVKISKSVLHTNLTVPESKTVICHYWMPQDVFFNLISRMEITMHCTFTESFSYAAAESIFLGTIPILSRQVAENLGLEEFGILIPKYEDSIIHILDHIRMIKEMCNAKKEYEDFIKTLQEHLLSKIKNNLDQTLKVLDFLGQKYVK